MKKNYIVILLAILSVSTYGQINWSKHSGNPVFQGIGGQWDGYLGYIGSVIFHDDLYHMWYNNNDGTDVGYATSPDGINWTRDENNPVFGTGSTGSWDQEYAVCGGVVLVDDTLHMWYTGHDGDWSNSGIGHATSTDGINWTRDADNPVLTIQQEGDWSYEHIFIDAAVHDGTTYHIWYYAWSPAGETAGGNGHATSINGSTWMRDASNPVLMPGLPSDWDNAVAAYTDVVYDGMLFHMWYAGGDKNTTGSDIGYAFSMDGTQWTKFEGNPVLRKGSGDSWDSRTILNPCVVDSAGIKYKMWYLGKANQKPRAYGYTESDTVEVPYVVILDGKPLYNTTDTVVAKMTLDGVIYIVPEGVSPVVDSILKYKVTSAEVLANTAVEILLKDIPYGEYVSLGVSSTGLISPYPSQLKVVPSDPPGLFLLHDTVMISYPIYATSDREGTLFLVKGGTPEASIRNPFHLIDSLVVAQANDTVEFSTENLETKDYWLYAADIYGLISEPANVTIVGSTGIEESEKAQIRIYPNPTNTYLTLETGKSGLYTIELISINGQLLFSGRMEGTTHQLDLSSFQKGVYFITIRSKDFVTTRKIIKLL